MSGDWPCSSTSTSAPCQREAVLVVADVAHHAAGDLGQRLAVDDGVLAVLLHVRVGRAAFAGDDDLVGGGERLAAQPGVGVAVVGDAELDVVGDEGVEDRVRDLVADLVRMTFGNRLARKQVVFERHMPSTDVTGLRAGRGWAANVRLSLCCRGGKSSKSVRARRHTDAASLKTPDERGNQERREAV